MPTYDYTAKDSASQNQTGAIDAPSLLRAAEYLKENHLEVISLEIQKPSKSIENLIKRKPSKRDIVVFSRNLKTMLEAGMTLDRSLEVLKDSETIASFKEVLEKVQQDVESGASLEAAMNRHPKVFTADYVAAISLGTVLKSSLVPA